MLSIKEKMATTESSEQNKSKIKTKEHAFVCSFIMQKVA